MREQLVLIVGLLVAFLGGCAKLPPVGENGEPIALRLGYFPNVTHGQPMIGVPRGDYQNAIGKEVKLEPQTFNAGPSVIEAVFAGHLDIAYVGPSPILNGFIQSKGEEVRVIAGSATNGVLVIGNKKRGITKFSQLKDGRIATPQYANTQDVSAKYFLVKELGVKLGSGENETNVFPMANPDIETLFAKNQIDGAWVPEPWGSRIIEKGLANLVLEEKDLWPEKSFPITNVIARKDFVEKYPDLVARFLTAHIRLTRELHSDPQAYAGQINNELKRLTTKKLPDAVIRGALNYTKFDYALIPDLFEQTFEMARSVKLMKADTLDVDKLCVHGPLESAIEYVDNLSSSGVGLRTESEKLSLKSAITTEGSEL